MSRFGEDPHDVNATHPFIFLIADENKDTIVFLGKIINPSAAPVEDPSAGDINDLTRTYLHQVTLSITYYNTIHQTRSTA